MARKLRTTEISSRKNITLDLNNGSETSDPSLPPPPPPSPKLVFTHSVEHTEDEEDDDMARTTSARAKTETVQCDKCNKMVSSRCLRYYHVCKEADPVASRVSKKKPIESVPAVTIKKEEQEEQPVITRATPIDERINNMKQYMKERSIRTPVTSPQVITRQTHTIYDKLFD
jgi:hypothetical protein